MKPSSLRREILPAAFAATVLFALGFAGPAHAVSGVSDSSVSAVAAQYTAGSVTPQGETPLPADEQVTLPAVQGVEDDEDGASPLPQEESSPVEQAVAASNGGGSDLPNTGFTVLAVMLLGAGLITGGLALRRTASRIAA